MPSMMRSSCCHSKRLLLAWYGHWGTRQALGAAVCGESGAGDLVKTDKLPRQPRPGDPAEDISSLPSRKQQNTASCSAKPAAGFLSMPSSQGRLYRLARNGPSVAVPGNSRSLCFGCIQPLSLNTPLSAKRSSMPGGKKLGELFRGAHGQETSMVGMFTHGKGNGPACPLLLPSKGSCCCLAGCCQAKQTGAAALLISIVSC